MGLFKRRKEETKPVEAETIETKEQKEYIGVNKEYPKVVQEIHHTFLSAADKLIEEADRYQELASQKDVQKGVSLASLGFKQAKQVEEAIEINNKKEMTAEQKSLISKYKVRYPLYLLNRNKNIK